MINWTSYKMHLAGLLTILHHAFLLSIKPVFNSSTFLPTVLIIRPSNSLERSLVKQTLSWTIAFIVVWVLFQIVKNIIFVEKISFLFTLIVVVSDSKNIILGEKISF